MSSGERPIGAAKGKQSDTEAYAMFHGIISSCPGGLLQGFLVWEAGGDCHFSCTGVLGGVALLCPATGGL
jgi:hypothetical protein